MNRDAIASAHRRMVEQVTSDERLLGLLPDDLSGPLVTWLEARLDDAARRAASADAYLTAADHIRIEARHVAEAAERQGDDSDAFLGRLKAAERRLTVPVQLRRPVAKRPQATRRRSRPGGKA